MYPTTSPGFPQPLAGWGVGTPPCEGLHLLAAASAALVVTNLIMVCHLVRRWGRCYDQVLKMLADEQGDWYVEKVLSHELGKVLQHNTRDLDRALGENPSETPSSGSSDGGASDGDSARASDGASGESSGESSGDGGPDVRPADSALRRQRPGARVEAAFFASAMGGVGALDAGRLIAGAEEAPGPGGPARAIAPEQGAPAEDPPPLAG